jgi:hypothetical protein
MDPTIKDLLLLHENGILPMEFYFSRVAGPSGHRVIAAAAPGMTAGNAF